MAYLKRVLARQLRRESTTAEKMLWQKLRDNKLGVKFRRQHPIERFLLDFYAPSIKLGIELDGAPHTIKANKEYDQMRTKFLRLKQVKILRFWNSEVERDIESVLNKVTIEIKEIRCL